MKLTWIKKKTDFVLLFLHLLVENVSKSLADDGRGDGLCWFQQVFAFLHHQLFGSLLHGHFARLQDVAQVAEVLEGVWLQQIEVIGAVLVGFGHVRVNGLVDELTIGYHFVASQLSDQMLHAACRLNSIFKFKFLIFLF
jgi:hypothetical protein